MIGKVKFEAVEKFAYVFLDLALDMSGLFRVGSYLVHILLYLGVCGGVIINVTKVRGTDYLARLIGVKVVDTFLA